MLDEMRALVALADAGSFTRAATQLSVTPSAATRMVQRLEASLQATLLDRTVKPPRFTPVGRNVLQHCRDVLDRVDDLNASVDPGAEPRGELRIGVSHALADADLAAPLGEVRERFPRLRLRLSSDFANSLTQHLLAGELHAAAVPVPHHYRPPRPLEADLIATDQMRIVAAADSPARHASTLEALDANEWVLNPPGCLLRAALLEQLSAAGLEVTITAEVSQPAPPSLPRGWRLRTRPAPDASPRTRDPPRPPRRARPPRGRDTRDHRSVARRSSRTKRSRRHPPRSGAHGEAGRRTRLEA